ncbi:hypothetical protein [Yaniella halotolerans]|uniref:hypothetical protein n=1 Tax=Yaniella halotolerans TaxID=225453 RepID=UPI0003B45BC0|nr:hypothetical protein [Yaniella halotolerans]
MSLPRQPVDLSANDHLSYVAEGSQPYDLFEIYLGTDGTYSAALITHVVLPEYLPANFRGRKQRKFISQVGIAALEQTVTNHFPEPRFIDLDDGGMLEFLLEVPAGQPVVPTGLEQRLLSETRAAEFYQHLSDEHSRFRAELDQQLRNAAYGTKWQKYFL